MMPKKLVPQEIADEIRKLGKNITNRPYQEGVAEQPPRNATKGEWAHIRKLLKEYDIALNPYPHACGFGVMLLGQIEKEGKVECLINFASNHLPDSMKKYFRGGDYDEKGTILALFRLTHTKRNRALLVRFNREPLRDDPEYYAY